MPGTTTLGVWEGFEADVGIECGRMASLVWDGYSFDDEQATYELDGIALVGEVCDEYLDRDGDGACLAGLASPDRRI